MAVEIERKFLLLSDDWKAGVTGVLYRQGYLCASSEKTVRVRIAGDDAFLTIKGKSNGISRQEYEYDIPLADAERMLADLCAKPLIEKLRYLVNYNGFTWEIDEFLGENKGLVVAEIELDSETESFPRPSWLGLEVSDDIRYFNSSLVTNPYCDWGGQKK